MERFIVILFSVLLGVGFFIWFSRAINRQPLRDFIDNNYWLLHPNAICYWRTAMALVGLVLYFFIGYENIGIVIFTFAAILDGVDGIVARKCKLGSKFGEWLDPFCDKLTYLPPLIGFAYRGIISINLIWVLVVIELFGQFFARRILDVLKTSGAANNFGKIKAIICFGLVIFCALLDAIPDIPDIYNISDEVLAACIILATASIVFKFIPNYVYADILSTLNFCCGIVSLVLTHHYYFAYAICVIIMGQLFDLFDGRMAEKHGGTKFGPYMDDVADFVSFGLAPAYVIIKSGGSAAWLFGLVYVAGVGFRLIRFVAVDKNRTDLPDGIFNGLPSPAGALIVLGGALAVDSSALLWLIAVVSVGLMVSHLRFAHFGRIIISTIPRPLFFLMCSCMVVTISFVLRTQNAQMFGYLILASVTLYMIIGRNMTGVPKQP
jgi:CDP-diacylglycerol--serine O-phosphatidyltransferase